MAAQRFSSSFLRTGLMAFILLMILNAAFADTNVTSEPRFLNSPKEIKIVTSACMALETKVSFLNESIGQTIMEKDFPARLKKNPLEELNALTNKLESSRCENTALVLLEMNKSIVICLLPKGFCERRSLLLNDINDLKDVDKKLLPYLLCFIEPSPSDDKKKQRFVKRMSNADEQKTRTILLEAQKEISNKTAKKMMTFLKMLPQNFILNADVLITRRNSNRSFNSSTPRDRWITRRNSNRSFSTSTPRDRRITRRNSNRSFSIVTPRDHWITRRYTKRPFRTTTPMNIPGTQKPENNSKWELLKKFLNDKDVTTLPDLSFFNEVPFQRLLKIPPQKLCSLLPNLQALNLTDVKKIIIYKQCQEELQKIAASVPKKLGKMLSLLRRKDIVNLENNQLQNLAIAACQYENEVNRNVEKLLAKVILPIRLLKRDQTELLQKTSCLLKYMKPSDLKRIKFSSENKKAFCKMIGASHLDKLREEEARNLTRYCIKEVLRNNMELSELGNLLNYVILSDIRNVTESQLLAWASTLQHFFDNDDEVEYTGKKLNKIYKDKFSEMTKDDLEKVGVLVGSWDSKDRRQIPNEIWVRSLKSFLTNCQKLDIEKNNNFKFCYKIIPFVLKAREQTQFRSQDTFMRIKRETRSQPPAPLTCKEITEIGPLIKTLTVEKIMTISKEEFLNCMQLLGTVTNFTSEQLKSLFTLVDQSFGPVKNWSAKNITDLGTLLAAIPLDQIKYMNLSDVKIVEKLGRFRSFGQHQLSRLFEKWLNTVKSGNISRMTLNDIQLVGNLLCGINKTDLETLSPQIIIDAIENIGKLDACHIDDQRMLLEKVITAIQKTVPWSAELLTSLGPLIRLLNETTLEKITMSDLKNVSSKLIAQIPAVQAAAINEIIIPKLTNNVNASVAKMLVTILCEAKNITSLKSLRGAIQNFTQNNLACSPRERDMFFKKLLNSSFENVTNIFKRVFSLIAKPRISTLEKFTREQVANTINTIFQKIPTTHLDALFNKWFKDLKFRKNSTALVRLDHEMLGFLACGLGFDIEKIDEIDENFILKALTSDEIKFTCTAAEQKQWFRKNFNSANRILQNLAKSNGFEIDSIMGILRKVGSLSPSSILNLDKELLENQNLFQSSPELMKLMMGIRNVTQTYLGNTSVLAVASTLCHLNVTDITKIDKTLLKTFSAGKYIRCSAYKQKVWLAALMNSTILKLINTDSAGFQTTITTIETLPIKAISNITQMLANITHLQVNGLLKMVLNGRMNASSTPELKVLQEISSCLEKIDEAQLSKLSTVEKVKYGIDNCIKTQRSIKDIINSTSTKIADMAINYLHFMEAMFGGRNISDMLKHWKMYETISKLPLTNVRAINATFEKWLKELKLTNMSLITSAKHTLLNFLACNLEFDVKFEIMPENIKKAVEKFVRGESCSAEKQKSWLNMNSNLISNVMHNLANILKNVTYYEEVMKDDGNDDKEKNDVTVTEVMKDDGNGNDGKDKDGDDGMQGDQPKTNDETSNKENKDERSNPIISGGESRKERFLVRDDFPFSAATLKKEADKEFVQKLWNFTRSPASQKETILAQMATKKAIKFLLQDEKILNEYLDKNRPRVLKLADQVNMRRAFLKKTKIDEEFLSTVSTVDSEAEAQLILTEAMKNIENKSKKDFIKSLPLDLIKKSGTMLIKEMYNDDTKDELIQQFQPKNEPKKDTRAVKKEQKMSLAELGLAQKIMTDKPDDKTMQLVLRSSLLAAVPVTQFDKLPKDIMCDKNIAINELQTDQILTMFKKCSSMVKEVLKTDADTLGILTTKVTKDMLSELDVEQASAVIQEACEHERELNIDTAKSFFSVLKEKGVNVIKESDKASCTIKYAAKEMKAVNVESESEIVQSVCRNLGNSMKEKMSKESGKMFKDICFKLIVDKKLKFEELGSLIFFLDESDIKKLNDDQLLEAAQILSQSVQNKLAFEEISNRLKKIPSLSNPATLTADNITLISTFIGGWNDIGKIPKENLESAALVLTEAMKTQVWLKKACIKETGDEAGCSQLDPYLKNIVEVLVAEQPTRRRKRRSITACNCELPSQLGSAAEMISSDALNKILCPDNFLTCMEKLSQVKSWTTNHQTVFAEKAKTILTSPKTTNWTHSTLNSVVAAIPGLSVDEISSLDLSTLDLAFAVGSQTTWESAKLKATFDVVYEKLLDSNSNQITSLQLQTFDNLLCGMDTRVIQSIKSVEYLNAARQIGNIECFTNDQHKLWVAKAKDVNNDINKWTDSMIASMGAVISGLPAKDLQMLTLTQIRGIRPEIIPMISPESLKNFHPSQLAYMSTSQAQKITAAQKSKFNDEQLDIIQEKLEYINSFLEKNNSDGSRTNLNIPVMIFSILLVILY